MGEVDEVHQAERDRKAAGEHEQQHAIGNAVEQNCEQRGHPVRALMLRRPKGRFEAWLRSTTANPSRRPPKSRAPQDEAHHSAPFGYFLVLPGSLTASK